jgi:hypothetical protein
MHDIENDTRNIIIGNARDLAMHGIEHDTPVGDFKNAMRRNSMVGNTRDPGMHGI